MYDSVDKVKAGASGWLMLLCQTRSEAAYHLSRVEGKDGCLLGQSDKLIRASTQRDADARQTNRISTPNKFPQLGSVLYLISSMLCASYGHRCASNEVTTRR